MLLLEKMGYISSSQNTNSNDIDTSTFEKELLNEMWLILIEANNSKICTTLGCLRRFLLFIEGLKDDDKL